jgi:hypothetical protein
MFGVSAGQRLAGCREGGAPGATWSAGHGATAPTRLGRAAPKDPTPRSSQANLRQRTGPGTSHLHVHAPHGLGLMVHGHLAWRDRAEHTSPDLCGQPLELGRDQLTLALVPLVPVVDVHARDLAQRLTPPRWSYTPHDLHARTSSSRPGQRRQSPQGCAGLPVDGSLPWINTHPRTFNQMPMRALMSRQYNRSAIGFPSLVGKYSRQALITRSPSNDRASACSSSR